MAKQQLTDSDIDKKALEQSMNDYYIKNQNPTPANPTNINENPIQEAKAINTPPQQQFNAEDFAKANMKETDPDLLIDTDVVKLPSDGHFYPVKEVLVEYLTATDEDILTTPALLENGTVLDEILKRKIKTPGLDIDNMLTGDKNAILIFLRASSYGSKYEVEVTNPKTGKAFKSSVDLTKIKYKELKEFPDNAGEFVVELPMRKKIVKFKILGDKTLRDIVNRAELMKETYNQKFASISSSRLKASITEIDGNRGIDYINRFVEAMPAGDALKVRSKMEEVTPGVDMSYDFVSPEGHIFKAPIAMGIDFFFPSL